MNTWDQRWMDLARLVASWSKDRSRKVGAVIVDERNSLVSVGWNGFPRNLDDDVEERHERPAKYQWTEHAERNAIYNAASMGSRLLECRIYVPWFPCADCARAIIQSGMSELIAIRPDFDDPTYGSDFRMVEVMLAEARVGVRYVDGEAPKRA